MPVGDSLADPLRPGDDYPSCLQVAFDARWPGWRDGLAAGSWPGADILADYDAIWDACASEMARGATSSVISDEEAMDLLRGAIEAEGMVVSDAMLECSVDGLRRDFPGYFDGTLILSSQSAEEQNRVLAIFEWCYVATSR